MKNFVSRIIRTVGKTPERDAEGNQPQKEIAETDQKSLERSIVAEHFDTIYYLSTNPDVAQVGHDALDHFLEYGWREGRNPTSWFRSKYYLDKNESYLKNNINPFYEYLIKNEHAPSSNDDAIEDIRTFNTNDVVRKLVEAHFDSTFYVSKNGDVAESGVNPLDHFLEYGWRENRNPTPWFDIEEFLKSRPDIGFAGVNPFYQYLLEKQHSQEKSAPELRADIAPTGADAAALNFQRSMIEPYFDREYYLRTYSDIAAAGVDPLAHFVAQGWHEGRNPTAQFDVREYLRLNPDVRTAGVNPFYHYIVVGKSEGRQVKSEHFIESRIISSARSMGARAANDLKQASHRVALKSDVLKTYIERLIPNSRNRVILSLSHDDYTGNYGGIQNCIGQEQKESNASGISYVHISPARPTLYFNPKSEDNEELVTIIIDGDRVGHATKFDLIACLSERATGSAVDIHFIIHSLLGFSLKFISNLHAALRPQGSSFWIHDCSTLCTNYALLRNDIEFCWAPKSESASCTVCVYGSERIEHLKAIRLLFDILKPDVIFPSETVRDFWQAKSSYTTGRAIVSPHAHPKFGTRARDKAVGRPAKVAFVGMASAHKGWHVFHELAEACRRDPRYNFFHFATSPGELTPAIHFVPTTVTSQNPSAMIDALLENDIDIVIQWSLCFETFSFSTLESVLAGTYIVGRRDSGNAAKLIEEFKSGILLTSKKDLTEFFSSGNAYDQLRNYRLRPVSVGSIELNKPSFSFLGK
ncbi:MULTISPECIES: glycosyltransferase family 4 protein [Methylobacterium]|uniref:glycosyltransferase family 4 protein n=1 Tax=Methylobacterium TaxID=407 RepID=UPI0013ED008F|nr:glycosyltransferase family 4 protein [Methylobacterium sp. DB0501]NGM38671.1 glycosyltransferase family 4 protein [Methylobacterium sp. DB0501]